MAGWVVLMVAAGSWFAMALKVDSDFSAFLPGGQSQTQRIFSQRDARWRDQPAAAHRTRERSPGILAAMSKAHGTRAAESPEFATWPTAKARSVQPN
jgi:hypothetical protein